MTNNTPDIEASLLAATTPAPNTIPVPEVNQTEHCLSCGADTPQTYCGECGLKNDDLRRSLFKLIAETMGGIFSFEGRMWRTWAALLFKPGKVARKYADGARTTYSSPIRVYLVVSFVLLTFLALSKTNLFAVAVTEKSPAEIQAQYENLKLDPEDQDLVAEKEKALEQFREGLRTGQVHITDDQFRLLEISKNNYQFLLFQSQKKFDSLTDKSLADSIAKNVEVSNAVGFNGEQVDVQKATEMFFRNPNAFNATINTWLPRVMFFFVPMAMFIGIIFIRGPNALLFDHMIHAFYVQSVFFMGLLASILLSRVLPGGLVGQLMMVAFTIYLILSWKRMFSRGWFKTIWTTLWVGGIYNLALIVAITSIGAYSFVSLAG